MFSPHTCSLFFHQGNVPEEKMSALNVCPEFCKGLLRTIAAAVTVLPWIDWHPLHWGETLNKTIEVIKTQHSLICLCVSVLFTTVPQSKREVTRDSAFDIRRQSFL